MGVVNVSGKAGQKTTNINYKTEYIEDVKKNVQDSERAEESFKLRCFSSLLDQPPALSRDYATPIPV